MSGNTNLVGQCSTPLTTAGPAAWGQSVSIMGVNPRINTVGAGPPNVEVKCHVMAWWDQPISLGHRTYARCTAASFVGQDVEPGVSARSCESN